MYVIDLGIHLTEILLHKWTIEARFFTFSNSKYISNCSYKNSHKTQLHQKHFHIEKMSIEVAKQKILTNPNNHKLTNRYICVR